MRPAPALFLTAAAVLAASVVTAAPANDATPVIEAERAFAARGQVVPPKQAFLEFAAPDGVLLDARAGARNAREQVATWPDRSNAGWIKWWPIYAGISASGDFGFTTGPATYGGDKGYTHFFTVWKKQPDGSWKWLIDTGAQNPGPSPFGPDTPVTVAPPGKPAANAAAAKAELCAAEAKLAARARTDLKGAYAAALAPEGRIFGMEDLPAVGRDAYTPALARRPQAVEMTSLHCETAASGDLGFSYGTAKWTADGKEVAAIFMRVWQRRAGGWVILADNLHADAR